MYLVANLLVALVALLHVYFLVLEMFLWTKPQGLRTFNQSLEKAKDSAVLAANQGLYNGFLAAGLDLGPACIRFRPSGCRSSCFSSPASLSPGSTAPIACRGEFCSCRRCPRRSPEFCC